MEELKLIIDALEVFWYGDPNLNVQKGFVQALGMGINVLAQVGAGFAARKRMKGFESQAKDLEDKLSDLEANRQDIIDPSAGAKTFNFQNPYNNLTVATGAAEFAAEEADISLANTLDTLRATGASAGGATALAQAALRSKAGISASIQQQEAANARMRAQGTMQMQGMQAQDQARVQALRARGQEFMFGAREMREVAQLDRTAAQLQNTQQRAANERSAMRSAFMGAAGSLGAGIAGGAFGDGKGSLTTGANKTSKQVERLTGEGSNFMNEGVTTDYLGMDIYNDKSLMRTIPETYTDSTYGITIPRGTRLRDFGVDYNPFGIPGVTRRGDGNISDRRASRRIRRGMRRGYSDYFTTGK